MERDTYQSDPKPSVTILKKAESHVVFLDFTDDILPESFLKSVKQKILKNRLNVHLTH